MAQDISRRTVLRGAGTVGSAAAAAATLAACGGSSSSGAAATASASPTPTAGAAAGGSTTAASGASVPKAEVPVGGGKVVGAAVVTQPSAGTYKAFSSVCTHQGCTVGRVSDNQINCPCHNSTFDANTGAVLAGPARAPLPPKTVTESGPNLLVS